MRRSSKTKGARSDPEAEVQDPQNSFDTKQVEQRQPPQQIQETEKASRGL